MSTLIVPKRRSTDPSSHSSMARQAVETELASISSQLRQGQYQKVNTAVSKVLKQIQDPTIQAHLYLLDAAALVYLNRFKNAYEATQCGIDLVFTNNRILTQLYYVKAIALYQLGNSRDSLLTAQKGSLLESPDRAIRLQFQMLITGLSKEERTKRILQLKMGQQMREIRKHLKKKEGDKVEVKALVILKANPSDAVKQSLCIFRIVALTQQGKYEEALQMSLKARSQQNLSNDAHSYFLYLDAINLVAVNNHSKAMLIVQQGIDLNPSSEIQGVLYYALATAAEKTGRFSEAYGAANQSRELLPLNHPAQEDLDKIQARLMRMQMALIMDMETKGK